MDPRLEPSFRARLYRTKPLIRFLEEHDLALFTLDAHWTNGRWNTMPFWIDGKRITRSTMRPLLALKLWTVRENLPPAGIRKGTRRAKTWARFEYRRLALGVELYPRQFSELLPPVMIQVRGDVGAKLKEIAEREGIYVTQGTRVGEPNLGHTVAWLLSQYEGYDHARAQLLRAIREG